MARADGSIIIDTRINSDGMKRGIADINGQMGGLKNTIKRVGSTIVAAFAVKQIVAFGSECLKLGSDLQEVQNVVDVTFPSMSQQVNDFARNAADSFGLSETMAKRYAGTFGAMAKSFNYSEAEAYDMATALTGLTGDVASFYNLSQDEAYTKLKSVFTGETESLKELGVVMTQTALDQFALSNGYGKTTKAMTEQEKVGLRLAFVQNQLSAASGDFLRTSDSWANQTRIFELRIQSLKATIGQGLINLFTPLIKAVNAFLERLMVAAEAFKNFTTLVMGGNASSGGGGSSQAAGEIAGLQAGYEGAAEGAEEFGEAVEESGKQVKKSLAPFDELIQIQTEAADNAGNAGNTGSGGAGDIMPPVLSPEGGEAAESPFLNNTMAALEAIKNQIMEINKLGFLDGLGNYKPILGEIKSDLLSIGKHLVDIFTDADVAAAAKRFITAYAEYIGKMTGSIASIGLTIASNIVGGIESFLSNNSERIKTFLIDIFDINAEIFDIVGNFFVAFADVFSVFSSQTAQDITGSIIQIFFDVFSGVTTLALKFVRDVLDIMLTPFTENADKIKKAAEETLEPIKVVVESVAKTVRDTVDRIMLLYDEKIAPFFNSIKEGVSLLLKTLLDGYNTYIVPVLDRLGEKFEEVMEGPVGDAINKGIEFIGKLAEELRIFWEEVLVPYYKFLIETILPVLAPIIEAIGNTALNVLAGIAGVISGVFEVLIGLIDFIAGVFTGDWERAWNGIEQIFQGIWNGLGAIIDTFMANAIDQIEGIVKAVSTAIEKIISLFKKGSDEAKSFPEIDGGGREFGGGGRSGGPAPRSYPVYAYSSLPYRVPKLATGTVVPPRAGEFAAILGDNKHETEVVSPLSTIKQALMEAISESGFGNRDITVILEVDRRQFGRVVYQANNEEVQRVGVRMVSQND